MRTLVLMRHAKSDYPDGVGDHERPLAPRGEREAGLAGEWLRENVPPIDAVLCSSAVRTRQTLARTGVEAPASYLEALYGAAPGTMIGALNEVDDAVATLLVVGHEPTVSHVTLGLAAPGSEAVLLAAEPPAPAPSPPPLLPLAGASAPLGSPAPAPVHVLRALGLHAASPTTASTR
jgi:phosphohistidine phosphatase